MNNISISMTFKNRAELIKKHFEFAIKQNYDLKKITYVIADGGSDDGIIEVLNEYKKYFNSIIYFIADRSLLPKPLKYGNPAIDYNISVLNCPDDCVIRCDAEVIFTNPNLFQYASDYYDHHKDYALHFNTIKATEEFDSNNDEHVQNIDDFAQRGKPYQTDANFCVSFSKHFFEHKMRGFDERFAYGYWCGEDTYAYHWVRANYNFFNAPFEYSPVHLWHKESYSQEERSKLVREETVPFIRSLQMKNEQPNANVDINHPEIIKNYTVL